MAKQTLPPHYQSGRWTETGIHTIQFSSCFNLSLLEDHHLFFVCAIFVFLLLLWFLPTSNEIWIQIILVQVLTSRGSSKLKCWRFDASARVATPQIIYFPRELWNVAAVKCIEMFFKVKETKILLFLRTKCFSSGPNATVLPKHLDWMWDISVSVTLYGQLSFPLSFVSKTSVIYCLSEGDSLLADCGSNSHGWLYG